MEYEEDVTWFENFKEEAKGDWELPNSSKVASLKQKIEAIVKTSKEKIWTIKVAKEAEQIWTDLVK